MAEGNGNPSEVRPQQPVQTITEPDGLQPLYANFCQVSHTPEELVLDFGLNPRPFEVSPHPIKISQRLVVNPYTAKRMWAALGVALERHERTFGQIEIDVNKRVTARPAPQPK